ncbi:MAG: hypothetical protein QXG00_00590 [Candidatus Woesearchaeota archaeon]
MITVALLIIFISALIIAISILNWLSKTGFVFVLIFMIIFNRVPWKWLLIVLFVAVCFHALLYIIHGIFYPAIALRNLSKYYFRGVHYQVKDTVQSWINYSMPFDVVFFIVEFYFLLQLIYNKSISNVRTFAAVFFIVFVIMIILRFFALIRLKKIQKKQQYKKEKIIDI